MKTGPLIPLGSIKGDTWERIYDYTVDATYGANVLTGGTATGGQAYTEVGATPDKAVDGSEATFFGAYDAGGNTWWKYQLPVAKIARKITMGSIMASGGNYGLKNWTLWGSNDNSNWTSITTGQHGNNGNVETWYFENSTAYLYYKVTGTNWHTNNATSFYISEITLHEITNGGNGVQTSLTISGLNGDVDEEYILESKVVNGYNGAQVTGFKINNDSGNNYGYQNFAGVSSTPSSFRDTSEAFIHVGQLNALGDVSPTTLKIFAKSGFVRTILQETAGEIATTTIGLVVCRADSWNNTADNITSLVIAASQPGGLGVGSSFQLYRKSRRSA